MAESTVEIKQEDGSEGKKVKLEIEPEGAPDAKKVKLEPESEDAPAVVKQEKADDEKPSEKENGENIKSENGSQLTAEEEGDPDLEVKIVYQIEYYFGNYNLPKDKFLQEQIKLDDGWIPLDVMLKFQRLAALSKNPATIVTCLRNSSKLIEVSEDGSKLRRSPNKPLPEMNEEWQKEQNERTVYCKGFPLTLTRITTYLNFFKEFGAVENITLRFYQDRQTKKRLYKGTLYCIFETKESADKFLALESVKYEEKELIRLTHAAHTEEKKKEKDERWGKKVRKEVPQEKPKPKKEFAKGCILKLSGINNDKLDREEIKATLVGLGADVAFIQYSKGDKEALVRLQSNEDGAASQFIKKLADKEAAVKFGEDVMELKPVEGEEEEVFLQKTRESMENFKSGKKPWGQHHKGGHKGGYKGNHRGQKRVKTE